MRICLTVAAVFALVSAASAAESDRLSAILAMPIHEAHVIRGDDGMDHVEYEILVVSVFPEPVTLSSVAVLDPAGKELMRIEGDDLAAATQTLFSKTPGAVIPASAAVSVDVDLILPPDTAPAQVSHKITYALIPDSVVAPMITSPEVHAPEVAIDRQPAIVIKPPLKGDGWLSTNACCTPNIHRDLRLAFNGNRIVTGETFAIDYGLVRGDRNYDGDGTKNEQHYAFDQDVLAVADGTVVFVNDGLPDETPFTFMVPTSITDYGGNQVILEIAPNVFALYVHLRPGSLKVKVGDTVKVGTPLAKLGNSGPSSGPHLHFGLGDKPSLVYQPEPAFRLRPLHRGRHARFQGIGGGGYPGDQTGIARGPERLSALRYPSELPVARPAITALGSPGVSITRARLLCPPRTRGRRPRRRHWSAPVPYRGHTWPGRASRRRDGS